MHALLTACQEVCPTVSPQSFRCSNRLGRQQQLQTSTWVQAQPLEEVAVVQLELRSLEQLVVGILQVAAAGMEAFRTAVVAQVEQHIAAEVRGADHMADVDADGGLHTSAGPVAAESRHAQVPAVAACSCQQAAGRHLAAGLVVGIL